jgi:dTDP-4-amino-4,6-dideoxygalactose transaminase
MPSRYQYTKIIKNDKGKRYYSNNIYISIDDDNPENKNFQEIIDKRFVFERTGYSYRITELEAAIGLSQMDTIMENVRTRRSNAEYLSEKIEKFKMLLYSIFDSLSNGVIFGLISFFVFVKNQKIDSNVCVFRLSPIL